MFFLDTVPEGRIFARAPQYLYLLPHPLLRDVVAHYTLTFPEGVLEEPETPFLTLLPDASGCFVFELFSHKIQSIFLGASSRVVQVQKDGAEEKWRLFIEFLPGGMNRLTGLDMSELADKRENLADILPQLYREIVSRLQWITDMSVLLEEVDALLLGCHRQCEQQGVAAGILSAVNTGGAATVRQLASSMGYSERQLQRIANVAIGFGAKEIIRICRINNVVKLLDAHCDLSDIALQAGYYDQSHFTHDFKRVCGVTPTQYLASMSDFYKENFKF